jgi:beta-lactamase superfamily II metal-dependent hydrolase
MDELRIRLLPVGEGDCILIRFPDATWAVIDCGGHAQAGNQAWSFLEYELRRDPPADRGLKENPIRFVVATHPDGDHIEGLPALLQSCPGQIGALYHCGVARSLRGGQTSIRLFYEVFAEEFRASGKIREAQPLKAGDEIPLIPPIEGIDISVLNPAAACVGRGLLKTAAQRNNISVGLQIRFGETVVLLPGDAQKDAWEKIVTRPEFLLPTVLKAAHHGAENATPPEDVLAKMRKNGWILISCGSGVDKRPGPATLDTIWRSNIVSRCTGLAGHCADKQRALRVEAPDFSRLPASLRLGLLFKLPGRPLADTGPTEETCCPDNEIVITRDGEIRHSAASRSCDGRGAVRDPQEAS